MAGDPDRFADLFMPFGKIRVRRMFGGEGLFRDGVMFGLVFDERIYLKTSEEGRQAFIAEGSVPFTYPLKKGQGITSQHYYALPDRLYDDPNELAEWALIALAVAHNTPAAKKQRKTVIKKRKRMQRRR